MSSPEELVEVYRAAGEMEAQVIRSLLEFHGIPSVLKGEAARTLYGINVDGIGEVRILVSPSEAKMACDLIHRRDDV